MSQASLAQLAGVSRATVSMALSGDPRVAADTRDKVLRAARALNYLPNLEARRLAARRGGRRLVNNILGLAYLLPDAAALCRCSFYHPLLNGMIEGCFERNQTLLILNVRAARMEDMPAVGQTDGLIMPLAGSPHLEAALRMGKPVVAVVRQAEGYACVDTDNHQAIRLAFEHLWARGHRTIGMISQPIEGEHAAQRWAAYCNHLRAAGVAYNPANVLIHPHMQFDDGGDEALARMYARQDRPTALIVYNDFMALGALRVAHRLGIRVPQDLSLISIDNIIESAHSQPALTTVSVELHEMGRRAALLLADFVESGAYRPGVVHVPPVLVVRESVLTRSAD